MGGGWRESQHGGDVQSLSFVDDDEDGGKAGGGEDDEDDDPSDFFTACLNRTLEEQESQQARKEEEPPGDGRRAGPGADRVCASCVMDGWMVCRRAVVATVRWW